MHNTIGEIIAAKIVNKRRARILHVALESMRQHDYSYRASALAEDLKECEYVTDADIVAELFPRK